MSDKRELLIKVQKIRDILIVCATGKSADDAEYQSLRRDLLAVSVLRPKLPTFLEAQDTLSLFWSFIKQFPKYEERRKYLFMAFRPAIRFLEQDFSFPSDAPTSAALSALGSAYVHEVWQKALDRRSTDPSGAITAARTLLEIVCKYILDESKVPYSDRDDLPKLYHLVSKRLNLAPTQKADNLIKKVFGGCTMVVDGVSELRNKFGDAHPAEISPEGPYARLAVNLAGAMAEFLITTWETQRKMGPRAS